MKVVIVGGVAGGATAAARIRRLDEIDPGKPVYVICQSGLRSYIATRILEGSGYEAYNFSGGYRFYDTVRRDAKLSCRATECGMEA